MLHEPKLREPADLSASHLQKNASLFLQPAWQGKGLSRLEESRGDPKSLGVGKRGQKRQLQRRRNCKQKVKMMNLDVPVMSCNFKAGF